MADVKRGYNAYLKKGVNSVEKSTLMSDGYGTSIIRITCYYIRQPTISRYLASPYLALQPRRASTPGNDHITPWPTNNAIIVVVPAVAVERVEDL